MEIKDLVRVFDEVLNQDHTATITEDTELYAKFTCDP